MFRGLFAGLIALALLTVPASSQMTMTGAGSGGFGGGAALPSLGSSSAATNASCAFVTTCNITTTGTVPAGFIVVLAGISNQSASTDVITGISVCGTSLTIDTAQSIPSGGVGSAIARGTTSGGSSSCTISVTFAQPTSIGEAGAAWIGVSNLSSSTPGTRCQEIFNASQGFPYDCTGGLTVSADGFGIVGMFSSGATDITAAGTVTLDAFSKSAGGGGAVVGIGHVTATCTASQCALNAANFVKAGIIGAPFR